MDSQEFSPDFDDESSGVSSGESYDDELAHLTQSTFLLGSDGSSSGDELLNSLETLLGDNESVTLEVQGEADPPDPDANQTQAEDTHENEDGPSTSKANKWSGESTAFGRPVKNLQEVASIGKAPLPYRIFINTEAAEFSHTQNFISPLANFKRAKRAFKIVSVPLVIKNEVASVPEKKVLKRKVKAEPSDVVPAKKGSFPCTTCEKTFDQQGMLTRHLPTHIGNFVCPVCAIPFRSKTGCSKHIIAIHGVRPKY